MQSFHFCVNLICAKDIFSSFWSQIVTIQLAYKASDVKADILPAVSGSLEIPITFNWNLNMTLGLVYGSWSERLFGFKATPAVD